MARLELRKSQRILSISSHATEELLKYTNIRKNKIIMLENPIDCSKFHPHYDFSDLKKKIINKDGDKLLLYAGPLIIRKNLGLLLETVEYLNKSKLPIVLLIIGKGILKKSLIKAVNKLHLEKKIIFIDWVEEVYPYYSIADLILLPSKKEGFGYLFLEGPACGCNILSFNTGIASKIVQHGFGIIAIDNEDFKKKSLQYLNCPNMDKDQAYKYIKEHYSKEQFGVKLSDIYKRYIKLKGVN